MRPTNGCELICDGGIGAEAVRQRRIGAGSSEPLRSKVSVSSIIRVEIEAVMHLSQVCRDQKKSIAFWKSFTRYARDLA
jgi:hypothetical protein